MNISNFYKMRLVGLEPTRLTAEEPKGDVTLVKGLKQHNSQSLQIQRLTYTGE
jgi:hypothetical protein